MIKVLSVDPGVMTGYCYATLEDGKLVYHPFQMVDDVDDFWRRLVRFEPKYIVIEDFEFRRGKRSAGGLNLFPVQMIGVARLWDLLFTCQTFVQKASTGKSYYTNTVLKQVGLYKRGIPHGMDASRHLLQWCMFGAGNQFIGSQKTTEFATISEEMEWWNKA